MTADLYLTRPLVETVVAAAADAVGVPPRLVLSPSRDRVVATARIASYLVLRRAGASLLSIAEHMERDHTTVMAGITAATVRYGADPLMRAAVDAAASAAAEALGRPVSGPGMGLVALERVRAAAPRDPDQPDLLERLARLERVVIAQQDQIDLLIAQRAPGTVVRLEDRARAARVAIVVDDDEQTVTFSRPNRPVGDQELTILRRDCQIPAHAVRIPAAPGQRKQRDGEGQTRYVVAFRWRLDGAPSVARPTDRIDRSLSAAPTPGAVVDPAPSADQLGLEL